jgi:cell wall-associated NlpC family hydrolase
MSDTTSAPTGSDSPVPQIRRRRHASQSADPRPNWSRRAGVAGGVISTTLAMSGMATPGSADAAAASDPTSTGSIPVVPALSTAEGSTQAVRALDQSVVDLRLDARRDRAAAAAQKKAERTKAAEAARRAAAEKAKAARKAALGSRYGERTALPPVSGSVGSVLDFLMAQVGKPYILGANGPYAYDCSGLTRAAFNTIGVDLPRTSQAQSTVGSSVPVSQARRGDLLFWGGQGSAYHVAVYIGNGHYLDAANPGKGVVVQKMAYYMPSFARRVA